MSVENLVRLVHGSREGPRGEALYLFEIDGTRRVIDLPLHLAEIAARSRHVAIWLTAIPISSETSRIADPLVAECQKALRG